MHDKAKRAMVIGLGRTGLSAARWLHAQGYAVAVTDNRAEPPELATLRALLPDAAVFVGGFSDAALANADLVVVSPGIPPHDPFVARVRQSGVELVGDIELFARVAAQPVVAVTGSNGKSTVATLYARMAECAARKVGLGGNLDTPALDLLDAGAELFVLELSSFQLESTRSLAPWAAALLNVSPDHLDWHGSVESYARAKSRIYRNAGTCVFNRDDDWSARHAASLSDAVSFGLDAPLRGCDFGVIARDGRDWLARGDEVLFAVDELHLAGAHNQANALACLALAHATDLPRSAMFDALRGFSGLPHRMSPVAERDGVLFINDSKATNVGASIAAIRGADRPLVLVAGGDGKGQDFAELADAMNGRVRHVVLLGKDAALIETALAGRIPSSRVADMRAAVLAAAGVAQRGDTVLLSPACASIDMFANYAARGEAFARAVRELDT